LIGLEGGNIIEQTIPQRWDESKLKQYIDTKTITRKARAIDCITLAKASKSYPPVKTG
jgi:hypothetical protein